MLDLQERDLKIKEWIKEAATEIKRIMKEELIIEEKTNAQDLVTNADKSIEKKLVEKIRKAYPNEKIVSEEGYGDQPKDLKGIVWFLDPIDGTTNFITQREHFAIMIAVYEDGIGQLGYVYDVMGDKMYSGIKNKGAFLNGKKIERVQDQPLSKGIFASSTHLMTKQVYAHIRELSDESLGVRMIGSAGLEICQVSMSKAGAYMASILAPWDIAPGQVIANEVGVICTDFEGKPLDLLQENKAIFANKTVHKQIMDTLQKKK